LREDDHPSGSVGEPLEHADFFPTWGANSTAGDVQLAIGVRRA
jgi:hypothetical protein